MTLHGNSKFTPERRKAIIDCIAKAIPYEYAAESNGICEDTLYEWLKIGRNHRQQGIDSDYASFSEAIKKAEADRIAKHLSKIDEGVDTWTSDAWILERRWWKHFSKSAPVIEFNERLSRIEKDLEKGEQSGETDNSKQKQITE